MKARSLRAVLAASFLLASAGFVAAQTVVARAGDLYAAAEYEECLQLLERAALQPEQLVAAGEYRALCLLALSREDDAGKAIADVLHSEPLYNAPANAPPRLKALVQNVQGAVLPTLIQQRYATAKSAYDAGRHDEAAEGFRLVVALLDSPAVQASGESSLSHYRTLASGFLDLIVAAAAVPPTGVAEPDPDAIYGTDDPGVIPPVVISQRLPPWSLDSAPPNPVQSGGRLQIVIDAGGKVESATLLDQIHPSYNQALLRAARLWEYEPAQKDGRPVKFRKIVRVALQASR